MKKYIVAVLLVVLGILMSGCVSDGSGTNIANTEHKEQDAGVQAIVNNQPIPDLGGYSFPRQVVIETYQALNKTVSTWSYTMTMTGQIIEICPSYGYPIPGGTELSNPQQVTNGGDLASTGTGNVTIANPEPNGLYPPSNSAGTLVECVNTDGTVSPEYWEPNVFALPYRIKSDIQLTRVDNSKPSITIQPQTKP